MRRQGVKTGIKQGMSVRLGASAHTSPLCKHQSTPECSRFTLRSQVSNIFHKLEEMLSFSSVLRETLTTPARISWAALVVLFHHRH